MKTVSVIIPVYNCASRIAGGIESVLAQTYGAVELIVVNDGSTDGTGEVCKKYDGIVYIEQENKGVAAARNVGLRAATGDYLTFLDADDYIEPQTLELLCRYIEEQELDVIQFACRHVYSNGDRMEEKPFTEPNKRIDRAGFRKAVFCQMMIGIQFNSVCRHLYKREITTGIAFNEQLETGEDLLFNMEVFARAQAFLFTTDVYYNYCHHETSLTGRGVPLKIKYKCNWCIGREMVRLLPAWGMDTPRYRFKAMFRIVRLTISKFLRVARRGNG